jgi:hypothetical protein
MSACGRSRRWRPNSPRRRGARPGSYLAADSLWRVRNYIASAIPWEPATRLEQIGVAYLEKRLALLPEELVVGEAERTCQRTTVEPFTGERFAATGGGAMTGVRRASRSLPSPRAERGCLRPGRAKVWRAGLLLRQRWQPTCVRRTPLPRWKPQERTTCMFRTTDRPVLEHDPAELVPLSGLSLDLQPPSVGGWPTELPARGITVIADDLGRPAVRRDDARRLIAERRDAETRGREAAGRQAMELERRRVASLHGGISPDLIPTGLTPAEAMTAAERDAMPRRQTVLEGALSNRDELVYHPVSDEDAS